MQLREEHAPLLQCVCISEKLEDLSSILADGLRPDRDNFVKQVSTLLSPWSPESPDYRLGGRSSGSIIIYFDVAKMLANYAIYLTRNNMVMTQHRIVWHAVTSVVRKTPA